MFVASYRNTERGAVNALAERVQAERALRIAAQRQATESQRALAEKVAQSKREAAERSKVTADELKAMGIKYRPTYRRLEQLSCRVFHVTPIELKSNRREKNVCFARQFIMYWAVRLTKLSLPQIGRLMGGRDHTTIISGRNVYPKKRAKMGRFLRDVR